MNIGQVVGPFVGSAIATGMGYRSVFYVTSLDCLCKLCVEPYQF